jgi:hypothetical protein
MSTYVYTFLGPVLAMSNFPSTFIREVFSDNSFCSALLNKRRNTDRASSPGVWSSDDLEHILGTYGAFIVERTGYENYIS